MLELAIVADDPRWDALEGIETEISGWAGVAAERAEREIGVSVASEAVLKLGTDAEVQELNQRFRGQDKPTNVLSFPAGEDWPDGDDDTGEPMLLGDIIIALETVEREAEEQGKPFRHHLAHLVVHGILHLYGFDHEDDTEAEEMEQLEREILARLGLPSPYDEPELSGI